MKKKFFYKKKEKGKKEFENELNGKNVDIDFDLMIDKQRFKEDIFKPHEFSNNMNICVCVRKRPIFNKEFNNGNIDAVSVANPIVRILEPKVKVDGITKFIETNDFEFDNSFNDKEETKDLYNFSVKPLINEVFEKRFITLFAYGQTGSGKTYTMTGLLKYTCDELFEQRDKLMPNSEIYISFYEIYGGKCFDLLNNKTKVMILEDGNGNINIQNLVEVGVSDSKNLLENINEAFGERTTHSTVSNDTSSRSHAICQILIKNNSNTIGKINVVDLAGSERAQDTQSNNRQRRFEGAEINKSLLALKECVRAMDSKSNHIPFRVSKLTMALRDSFYSKNFKCKVVMIACVCPGSLSTDHTINTLRYADRLKTKNKNNINNIISKRQKSKSNLEIKKKEKSISLKKKNNNIPKPNLMRPIPQNKPKKENNNNSNKKNDNINNNKFEKKNKKKHVSNSFEIEGEDNEIANNKNENNEIDKNKLKNNEEENSNQKIKCKEDFNFMRNTIKRDDSEVNNEVFDFHEKVNDIIDQHDEMIALHMNILREDAQFLTKETEIISKAQNEGEDYEIDNYVNDIESIVKKKIYLYTLLGKKISKFKEILKEEEEISKNMKLTIYY